MSLPAHRDRLQSAVNAVALIGRDHEHTNVSKSSGQPYNSSADNEQKRIELRDDSTKSLTKRLVSKRKCDSRRARCAAAPVSARYARPRHGVRANIFAEMLVRSYRI